MQVAILGILITPIVIRVQEKVESAAERSMLSGALAKQKIHDLSLAEVKQEKQKDEDNNKIVQKYSEIYVYQGRPNILGDNKNETTVIVDY
jgi:protein subunit release factor B